MADPPSRSRRGALPNLIVIGASRCGTTSLHHYLSRHPEISMSRRKELNFFADRADAAWGPPVSSEADRAWIEGRRGNWSRGFDWYRAQFDPSAAVRGESSPIYSEPWLADCAGRIAEHLPEAKLIMCVRDPVERAISHHRYDVATGHPAQAADEALSVPGNRYVLASRYADRLAPHLSRTPPGRLHFVVQEELASRPAEILAGVFSYLEVDPEFTSPLLEKRWNRSGGQHGVRWRAVRRLRYLPGWRRISSLPPQRLAWLVERGGVARRTEPAPGPSPEVRVLLRDQLRGEGAKLAEIAGREFPSWASQG